MLGRSLRQGTLVNLRHLAVLAGLAVGVLGMGRGPAYAAEPAAAAKPAITAEAAAALLRMGHSLQAAEFSFTAQTIRVYSADNGEFLHIFHTLRVVVHRPNRLVAEVTGDDGSSKVVFDGKTAWIYAAARRKYAKIPVPGGTIEAMLKEAVGRLGVDFPLADFLTSAPNKAFLSGVTSGRVVDTVTIDGAPYLHLYFEQPPGIELELWLSKNEASLPRRLIVTYTMLPGQPNFIALFSDWNFAIHPTAADFSFTPPPGAVQVALKPTAPPPAGKERRD
jgi:hypothetical protein